MNVLNKIRDKLRALPDWSILGLLMLFALVVRLVYLYLNPMETRDGIYYIRFTQGWFERGAAALPSFARMPPPLYCYMGKMLMYLGLGASQALLLINLFFGVATLVPAYFVGKTIYDDRKAGLWFASFTAVLPPLVTYSCTRTRECIYLFFLFWIAALWIIAIRTKWRPWLCSALCGAMVSIAMHCRYEAFELLPFVVIGLPASVLIPSRQWKKSLLVLSGAITGVLIALAVMMLLPGMPNIVRIFYNQVYAQCLGTSLNPL